MSVTLKIILLSLGFIALAVAAMAIKVILLKKGSFTETSIGHNKELRKRNITCAKHDEIKLHGRGKAQCDECVSHKNFGK